MLQAGGGAATPQAPLISVMPTRAQELAVATQLQPTRSLSLVQVGTAWQALPFQGAAAVQQLPPLWLWMTLPLLAVTSAALK